MESLRGKSPSRAQSLALGGDSFFSFQKYTFNPAISSEFSI
jgi:hypothetical protein